MKDNEYKKEISELFYIDENRYEEQISRYNKIVKYNVNVLKENNRNLPGIYANTYMKIYKQENDNFNFISEKCINRFERLTSKCRYESGYEDLLNLVKEINKITSFEDLWILEYEDDDGYAFDETKMQLLFVGRILASYFIEKTQKLYDDTFLNNKQNKKSADETKSPKVKTKIMNVKESKKQ